MSQARMIFLTGRSWSIPLGWQWCLCACLAGVILFVSGCAKVAVPNVEGLTQDDATKAITGAKLKAGSITQQANNTVASGNIISQDPASGGSVAEGSPVKLVIFLRATAGASAQPGRVDAGRCDQIDYWSETQGGERHSANQ